MIEVVSASLTALAIVQKAGTFSPPLRVDRLRKTLGSVELGRNFIEPSAKSDPKRPPVCSECAPSNETPPLTLGRPEGFVRAETIGSPR
jgi:hypothetical protein